MIGTDISADLVKKIRGKRKTIQYFVADSNFIFPLLIARPRSDHCVPVLVQRRPRTTFRGVEGRMGDTKVVCEKKTISIFIAISCCFFNE